MLKSIKPFIKITGDAALLLALAVSPIALAQDADTTREERLAERQAQIDARREAIANGEERSERTRLERAVRTGENGVNHRRRAFENGNEPGEFARRRYNAANLPARPPVDGQRPQRPQRPATQ